MPRLLRPISAATLALCAAACGNLNFYSESEENQLGAQAYAEETSKYPHVTSGPQYEMVQRVGRKIAAVAERPDFAWEFKLLRADDQVNAFCLPGGKVAVYTGILPITENEDGLAAVIGHEVAHATLRHGGKRMTQHGIAATVVSAVGAGLSISELGEGTQQLVMGALGLGAQVGVLLPYSRDHETEADEIGVRYLIRAGYDPYEAPRLWERMAKLGSGGPTWLSTHPDPLQRAANLEKKIPQFVAEERNWQASQPAPASAPGGAPTAPGGAVRR